MCSGRSVGNGCFSSSADPGRYPGERQQRIEIVRIAIELDVIRSGENFTSFAGWQERDTIKQPRRCRGPKPIRVRSDVVPDRASISAAIAQGEGHDAGRGTRLNAGGDLDGAIVKR